jgi:hypothetical protein
MDSWTFPRTTFSCARHQRPTLTRRDFILIFVLTCTHTSTSVIVQTLIFTLSLCENDARGTVGESFSFPDHVSTSECNIHQHNKTNYRLNFLHASNTFMRIGLPWNWKHSKLVTIDQKKNFLYHSCRKKQKSKYRRMFVKNYWLYNQHQEKIKVSVP